MDECWELIKCDKNNIKLLDNKTSDVNPANRMLNLRERSLIVEFWSLLLSNYQMNAFLPCTRGISSIVDWHNVVTSFPHW